MSPLATKISAFGLLSVAVSLAAMREGIPFLSEETKPGLREANSRHIPGDEASPPRGPTKARGRLSDQSYATRMKARGRITVGGQVNSPGPMALTPGMTLEMAIEKAGGATPFASMRRVSLIRGAEIKEYDLTQDSGRMIVLSADDAVLVPQKMIIGR